MPVTGLTLAALAALARSIWPAEQSPKAGMPFPSVQMRITPPSERLGLSTRAAAASTPRLKSGLDRPTIILALGRGPTTSSGTAALNVTNWLVGRSGRGRHRCFKHLRWQKGHQNRWWQFDHHSRHRSFRHDQSDGRFISTMVTGESWIGKDGGNATRNMNGGHGQCWTRPHLVKTPVLMGL